MEDWFIFGNAVPLLYAITNHFDKQIMARFFKEGGPGALLIVSALFSAVVIALLWIGYDWIVIGVSDFWLARGYDLVPSLEPDWFDIGVFDTSVLFVSGLLNVGIVWFYLLALREEHASRVVVFYQLVPVLGLIFGFVLLHETINLRQLAAMGLIIAGAAILSFDMDANGTLSFKRKTVLYMILACLCWVLQAALFKLVALKVNVWNALFWQHVAMLTVGVLILLLSQKYRQHFVREFKQNSVAVLIMNLCNEALYNTGAIVAAVSYMLKEQALILTLNSFQPIYVLAIGLILVLFGVAVDSINKRILRSVIPAVMLTMLGTYLIST